MNDPTSPTPSAPAAPTVTPQVKPHTKASVSESEAASMITWLKQDLAQGRISPEQAQKAFDQLNATAEQRGPDHRTDEQKTLDQHFPPAKPEDYRITYGGPGEDVKETPELKAFDANARGWLAGAGFPRDVGNSLVSAIGKTLEVTKGMSDDQLEAYGHKEFERLQAVHREKLEERLQAAALMIDQLERQRPGLKNLLKSRGIGDSAAVASLLAQHAAIYHARKGQ